MTLLKNLIRINQTLLEKFSPDLTQNSLSRPCSPKVKRICMKPEKRICSPVVENFWESTRPCSENFRQTLLNLL
jgi:hypothetical protein